MKEVYDLENISYIIISCCVQDILIPFLYYNLHVLFQRNNVFNIVKIILFTADRAFLSWLVKVPSEAEQMRARQVLFGFILWNKIFYTGKLNSKYFIISSSSKEHQVVCLLLKTNY